MKLRFGTWILNGFGAALVLTALSTRLLRNSTLSQLHSHPHPPPPPRDGSPGWSQALWPWSQAAC